MNREMSEIQRQGEAKRQVLTKRHSETDTDQDRPGAGKAGEKWA